MIIDIRGSLPVGVVEGGLMIAPPTPVVAAVVDVVRAAVTGVMPVLPLDVLLVWVFFCERG